MRFVIKALGGSRPHKYIRRIPKPGGGYRYIYSETGIAHRAQEGERINIRERGTHDVVGIRGDAITLRDAEGQERTVSFAELHGELHSVYGQRMVRGAERLAQRYVSQIKNLPKMDPEDPEATYRELAGRFKHARVEPLHAKRLMAFLAAREGWHSKAHKTFLAMASDPKVGKLVSDAGRDIIRGAENLRNADQGRLPLGGKFRLSPVEPKHVVRAAVARVKGEGHFSDHVHTLQRQAASELAAAETAMGALEAAEPGTPARQAMHDYAQTVIKWDATRELEEAAKAFPGLRELPEIKKMAELQGRWTAHLAIEKEPSDGRPGIPGAETLVFVSDGQGSPTPQKARYRLLDAGDVHASHDPTTSFAPNPKYPEGVQERAYHRDKNEQEKVRSNAAKLRPEFLANTNPDAVNGPPIVTPDGIVLGGNSRTMSLQIAHNKGGAGQASYLQHLRSTAHHFGFTSEQIDRMKSPILVREVEVHEDDKRQMSTLVRRYNESFTQAMDPRVDQVARARLISEGMLRSLAHGMSATKSDGSPAHPTLNSFLSSTAARQFVDSLQRGEDDKSIIDRRNRSQYIGSDGKLNEDGKVFVERILVGHVVPHADVLSDMPARQMSAVARSVPHIVAATAHGHDLRQPLREAIEVQTHMRRRGLRTLEEFDASGGFGDVFAGAGFEAKPKLTPEARLMLDILTTKPGADKPVRMAGVFRQFAVHASRNPAGQVALPGQKKKTTAGILDDVVNPKARPITSELFFRRSVADESPIIRHLRMMAAETARMVRGEVSEDIEVRDLVKSLTSWRGRV